MRRRSPDYWVRRGLWLSLSYILLLFTLVITALPFFWMVTTSLKERAAVMRIPPQWMPNPVVWQNYIEAWSSAPFGRYFFNSFFIAIATTVGDVLTSIPAGYALAKMAFLGRGLILALLLGTLMIPGQMLLVPTFILVKNIGWYNTYQVLIIPWTAGVFGMFLLRQFFKTVPDELWDSARIDGCSRLRYMFQIAVPLVRPGLATVALLKFVGSWNAFLWVIVMTDKVELRTVPVGLRFLQMEMGDYHHLLMAAATLAIIPILILFAFAQKQFIQGIARTGLK